ncbi:hypothetical protein ACGFMK_48705 [Amycolatopsis sp. NPDC049252]|uniref:hypothetical protein n=1 Tax=Amycolatopsis sp. NPDC049252 TaxID=3363933 RepID=UPI00371FEECA
MAATEDKLRDYLERVTNDLIAIVGTCCPALLRKRTPRAARRAVRRRSRGTDAFE